MRVHPTLDLKSGKSQCFNHRDELDSAVYIASKLQIGLGNVVDGVLYIAQASYIFIHGIMLAKKLDQAYLSKKAASLVPIPIPTFSILHTEKGEDLVDLVISG